MIDALVPTLRSPHEPGRDLVWAVSLAAAWKALGEMLGDAGVLASPSPEAAALAARLAAETELAAHVPAGVLVAAAGVEDAEWLRDTAARVRSELGIEPSERLLGREASGLVASYACLSDQAVFDPPLQVGNGFLRFNGSPVRSFGLWEAPGEEGPRARRIPQVIVHHHRVVPADDDPEGPYELDGGEEFVVELRGPASRPGRRLLVARLHPGATLADTVDRVTALVKTDALAGADCHLREDERFEMPCLDLSLDAAYGELWGASLRGRAERLGVILHQVAFRLNEGGMTVRAESRLGGLLLPPRRMLCNGPSLILLTYEDRPALAVWFETRRFLIPA